MCTWVARQGRAAVLLVDMSKAVQEQQRSTGHGKARSSSREDLGASPRPPGEGSSHMGRPGQQAVARRDPGELERSWRGVLSR